MTKKIQAVASKKINARAKNAILGLKRSKNGPESPYAIRIAPYKAMPKRAFAEYNNSFLTTNGIIGVSAGIKNCVIVETAKVSKYKRGIFLWKIASIIRRHARKKFVANNTFFLSHLSTYTPARRPKITAGIVNARTIPETAEFELVN